MDTAKSSLKALENWAKKATAGYKDVNVRDMSVSFRDGLAFCAIIHHYRPDLIDFDSLSKENIFNNNSLAFSTAEKQLGVPALLDAEDMEKYAQPDRLSIITYLAQLHNCFENQNKVNKIKSNLKKSLKDDTGGPPIKVSVLDTKILPRGRHEVCYACKNRVFILERLIVDSKLYHRTCFRCSKCSAQLNPGDHVESDTFGSYECSICPRDQKEDSDSKDDSPDEDTSIDLKPHLSPVTPQKEKTVKQSPLSSSVTSARNSFLQQSLKTNATKDLSSVSITNGSAINKNEASHGKGISVRQKISAFETNGLTSPGASADKSVRKSLFTEKDKLPNKPLQMNICPNSIDEPCIATEKNADIIKTEKSSSIRLITEKPSVDTNSKILNSSQIKSSPDEKSNHFNSTIGGTTPKFGILTEKERTQGALPSTSIKSEANRQASYNSALSRDIFRPNIAPLKLSLSPSINNQKKDSLHSLSSLKLPDLSPRITKLDIPVVKSSFSSLPRQNSCVTLSTKESTLINESNSEGNLTDLLNKRWSNIRRSSLESGVRTNNNVENETVQNIFDREKSVTDQSSESAAADDDVASPFEMKISRSIRDNTSINKDSTKEFNASQTASSDIDSSGTPVPKPRRSLEALKLKDIEKTNDVSNNSLENSVMSNECSSQTASSISPEKVPSIKTTENSELENKLPDKPSSVTVPKIKLEIKPDDELYPDELNPFGDEEEENEYPDDLNPFGDDEADTVIQSQNKSVKDYDESKNPFASDDEEESNGTTSSSFKHSTLRRSSKDNLTSESPFYQSSPSYSGASSPSGSLRGTTKKRKAPKPPKLSEIFPGDSIDSQSDMSFASLHASPSPGKRNIQTPSPKVRKGKPAPLPPQAISPKQNGESDSAATTKLTKDMDNMKLKSGASASANGDANSSPTKWKKKKRPAPPVPIPQRRENKKIPLKEIIREMKEIEAQQKDYEKQGRELELLIRERDKDVEQTFEEEEYIMRLFELVNQKNALFRRQAELMYIKRSQRLEEEQADLENQIRILMAIPASEKTDEERLKEDELMLQYIDVVEQRNSIIDSIEMDRRRELEEDCSVQEQLEIKNGDLPIAAEIKEKHKSKEKKAKKKKEKKKKEDSGKGTLRRKIFS